MLRHPWAFFAFEPHLRRDNPTDGEACPRMNTLFLRSLFLWEGPKTRNIKTFNRGQRLRLIIALAPCGCANAIPLPYPVFRKRGFNFIDNSGGFDRVLWPFHSGPTGSGVMKLSRTVAYAVRATLQLAQCPQGMPIPCSKLASEGHMPERFLLQILRNLVTHGILRSTRGVEGGYALTRPPEQISLLEVIEAIEGPIGVAENGNGEFSDDPQPKLLDALRSITDTSRRQLDAIKFSQLLEPPK
jgi:Rrf2 family protein